MSSVLPLPTAAENPTGLYQRYHVTKMDGTSDPDAVYFVLRLDSKGDDSRHILASRRAMRLYCCEIAAAIPQLAKDIERLLDEVEKS